MLARTFAAALAVALAFPALGQGADAAQPAPRSAARLATPALQAPLAQESPVDSPRRSPMITVATNALYGGAAGAVVGVGIALIEGDNWARDITVGAGLGVLAGAVVGGVMAYGSGSDRVARDGLGTPERDRDRQRPARPVARWALRW